MPMQFKRWGSIHLTDTQIAQCGFIVQLPEAGVCTLYTNVSFTHLCMGQFSDQFGNSLDATEDMLVAVVEISNA